MALYVDEEFERLLEEESSSPDVDMPDASNVYDNHLSSAPANLAECPSVGSIENSAGASRLILGIDFGTTFSSVAFFFLEHEGMARSVKAESIKCVDHYPDRPLGITAAAFERNPTVPSELLCSVQKAKRVSKNTTTTDVSDTESVLSIDEDLQSPAAEHSDNEPADPQTQPNKPKLSNVIWGWGTHSKLARTKHHTQDLQHLRNFKLLLDEDMDTKMVLRDESQNTMKQLKPAKLVDIIGTYLTQLLKHTKTRLPDSRHLDHAVEIEYVLSIPTSWSYKACQLMQDALTVAIRQSEMPGLETGSIKNLFIVAESEAAATLALNNEECETNMTTGQSYLLLDCGGGTVDAVVYKLTRTDPPRLCEVVPPDAVSHGSSFLNRNYKTLLENRLRKAQIKRSEYSVKDVITDSVLEFESEKRTIDILDRKVKSYKISVPGLQDNETLSIKRNTFEITRHEMYEVFKPCLHGVENLMIKQLDAAKKAKVNVNSVILTGGFGESPSLKNFLTKKLEKVRNFAGHNIELIRTNYIESAVACGAVLRALRKEHGPDRFTKWSYGILLTLEYDEEDKKHRRFSVLKDPADGENIICDVIHWIIHQGQLVPNRYEKSFQVTCRFKLDEAKFVCYETLYVSSKSHESGYKIRHEKNRGAQKVGRVEVDLTFLKCDDLIKRLPNAEGIYYSFYEVLFELWFIIEGRSLRLEARSLQGDLYNSRSFCVAARFKPGTA